MGVDTGNAGNCINHCKEHFKIVTLYKKMVKIKYILLVCLVVLVLPALSQKFYDTAGHEIAYQKGVILFDSAGRKLGRIWPGGYKDTAGNIIIYGYRFTFPYKYKQNVGYYGVYVQGNYVYANWQIIGRIDGYHIYDASGDLLGYTDKDVPRGEAITFYFLLLPYWGGGVP